jgi:dihydroorotate dehydrogenase electron transfer subunit
VRRVRAEVLSARRFGAYHSLTLVAPEIAERARPGQFLSVAMPEGREFFLRRHFSIHDAARRGGWAGTLEFAFEARGRGTSWLGRRRPHQFLDVIGPLGKAFAYPRQLTNCLLVAEGHGAAAMYFLAQALRGRGKRVDMAVGGPDEDHVFKPIEGKRLSQTIAVVTADGSLGDRGSVIDALPEIVERAGTQVVYGAGPHETLRRLAEFCREHRLPAQIAVEERMACGTGLCFGCAVPIARKDGTGVDSVRACVDGPVFNPARVVWDAWIGEADPTVRTPATVRTPPDGLSALRSRP